MKRNGQSQGKKNLKGEAFEGSPLGCHLNPGSHEYQNFSIDYAEQLQLCTPREVGPCDSSKRAAFPWVQLQYRNADQTNEHCKRCLINKTAKRCLECSIALFCQACFKEVHCTQKMSSHQSQQIGSKLPTAFRGNSVNQSSPLRACLKDLAKSDREQLATKQVGWRNSETQKGINMLECLQKDIQEEIWFIQKEARCHQVGMLKVFESIISEVQLKTIEFQSTIRALTDSTIDQRRQLLQDVEAKLSSYHQIAFMDGNETKVANKTLDQLAISTTQMLNSHKARRERHARQQLRVDIPLTEIMQINQSIARISPKSFISHTNQSKSIINIHSPKNPRKGQSAKNSLKTSGVHSMTKLQLIEKIQSKAADRSNFASENVSRLTIPSTKSLNYLDCLSSVRAQKEPKSVLQNNIKSRTGGADEGSQVSSSISAPSYRAANPSKNSPGCKLAEGHNPQARAQGAELKDTVKKAGLVKGARGAKSSYLKGGLKFAKSGIGKALANIQNTKEQLKQIRLQLSEFSSRAEYNKAERGKQEESESEEGLNISHISIESLVQKRKNN